MRLNNTLVGILRSVFSSCNLYDDAFLIHTYIYSAVIPKNMLTSLLKTIFKLPLQLR